MYKPPINAVSPFSEDIPTSRRPRAESTPVSPISVQICSAGVPYISAENYLAMITRFFPRFPLSGSISLSSLLRSPGAASAVPRKQFNKFVYGLPPFSASSSSRGLSTKMTFPSPLVSVEEVGPG